MILKELLNAGTNTTDKNVEDMKGFSHYIEQYIYNNKICKALHSTKKKSQKRLKKLTAITL